MFDIDIGFRCSFLVEAQCGVPLQRAPCEAQQCHTIAGRWAGNNVLVFGPYLGALG